MAHDKVDFSSVAWGSVEWTNLVTLYLRAYESVGEARNSIGQYFDFYSSRPHSSLTTPHRIKAYFS